VTQPALEDNGLESRSISPFREFGAYEALWAEQGTTFKSIAELFHKNPGAVPSHFVSVEKGKEFASKALEILNRANVESFGIRIHGAGEYPKKLRDARYPIELLYFQGWWDLAETPSVAVVGTRNPTEEGKARAAKLVKCIVEDNLTVVSGLARGIDSIAHRTAMSLSGRTIAVLGTPLSKSYPKENSELQNEIAKKFLLISQVPICRYSVQGPKGNRFFFPERNITMSALTDATIVVEAGETSGTLIQSRAALSQGRKLFILDSCFRNSALTWPEKFERLGAIRVKEYEDIRKHLAP